MTDADLDKTFDPCAVRTYCTEGFEKLSEYKKTAAGRLTPVARRARGKAAKRDSILEQATRVRL